MFTTARPRGNLKREFITYYDFLKHRLHIRPYHIESDHYFHAGSLFQEYIVDSWAAAEHSRLEWFCHHQHVIRADLYCGVVDALREGLDLSSVGCKVILPSSFTSGPRFIQKCLQDALALLRIHGGSDLFITFTANPKWREITEALLPGQTASDRPDIVARVFHLKVASLLDDIMNKNVFGEGVAYVYTVEYQKRGLPHIHLIVFLHPAARLSTPDCIDQFVSTEIPDENEEPVLHELVKTHMIHGPCGIAHYSPCLNEKKECSKGFPKPFQQETEISGDSYVKTRRRNNGNTVNVRGTDVHNGFVVSYSPYLLMRYQTHINVECTTGFNAIKYIYKVHYFFCRCGFPLDTFILQYIYKGPDRATVAIDGNAGDAVRSQDEVQLYLDARYFSSMEAYARSMGWATHRVCLFFAWPTFILTYAQEYPAVQQLQVHLENEQCVTFRPDGSHSLAGLVHDTQLTAFFKANQKYEDAREFYYSKFPSKFVWNKDSFEWVPRQKQKVYGRLVYIPPNVGEKFYARLILSVAKNLQSFEDLRSFNGVVYDTIRLACLARGLLEDDGEWCRSLDEAKHFQTGFILRSLFVIIVRDCLPADPLTLWEEYKEYICDDLPRLLLCMGIRDASDDIVYNYGLHLVEQILSMASNKSMKDVGMSPPTRDWDTLLSNSLVQDHLRFEPVREEEMLQEMLPSLNDDQRSAFDRIMQSFLDGHKETFFVVGAAGAGKTFLYNTLCHAIRSQSLLILCVAYSGIAAQLLPGGRTAHSSFKIPFVRSQKIPPLPNS